MATYSYPCPTCGRETQVTAKYAVRQNRPCLFCIRKETGWQHQPGCALPDEHRGPCIVHVDYPHEPGRLYDCPACEAMCHCTPGQAECIYEGEHNGLGIAVSDEMPFTPHYQQHGETD